MCLLVCVVVVVGCVVWCLNDVVVLIDVCLLCCWLLILMCLGHAEMCKCL